MSETLQDRVQGQTVATVMSRDVISIGPGTNLLDAFERMVRQHIHHLPVIDEKGGCLALIDFPAIATGLLEALVRRGETVIPAGMPEPPRVGEQDSLSRAATAMHEVGTDACVVVDSDGRMLGLVTARDIVSALAD